MRAFVSALGADIASSPSPPPSSPSSRGSPGKFDGVPSELCSVTASVSIPNGEGPHSPLLSEGGVSSQNGGNGQIGDSSNGTDVGNGNGGGVNGRGERGGACQGESGSLPLPPKDDSALSMVLAFVDRVMAPGVHEASAMCTGGERPLSVVFYVLPLSPRPSPLSL